MNRLQLQLAIEDDVHAYVGEGRHEFKAWLAQVDLLWVGQTGVSIFDLGDMPTAIGSKTACRPKRRCAKSSRRKGTRERLTCCRAIRSDC